MKYRKKPVVIEAEQYRRSMKKYPKGVCLCNEVPQGGFPHIHTAEGSLNVSDGDWIITGIAGEHYPCKPNIFAATYEPIFGGDL